MGTLMYINRAKTTPTEKRITIPQTLVLSTIKYATTIWETTNSTKVQKIQNFSIKVADGKARNLITLHYYLMN